MIVVRLLALDAMTFGLFPIVFFRLAFMVLSRLLVPEFTMVLSCFRMVFSRLAGVLRGLSAVARLYR